MKVAVSPGANVPADELPEFDTNVGPDVSVSAPPPIRDTTSEAILTAVNVVLPVFLSPIV